MPLESGLKSANSDSSQPGSSPNSRSEKDGSILDENQVFKEWRSSTGQRKEDLEQQLVKLLMKHAHAICWNRIPDLLNDHGWICNEAVFRALKHSASFKGMSKFSTWFHRIVFNICNNALKAKQKKGEEVELTDAIENSRGSSGGPVDKILWNQVKRMGSKEDRQILRLLSEGWTKGEIGEKLGISANLVQVRWYRLRERLNRGE